MNTTSNPSTPSSYVVSSLNPTKNLPFTSSSFNSRITTKDELDRFEKLPMVQSINSLEKTLTSLTSRISLFKEDGLKDDVDKFVAYSQELLDELDKLEHHAQLGGAIDKLEDENDTLDDLGKLILKELLSCREALKRLPRLPASKRSDKNLVDPLVDVKEVLKYAMKLAKFTRAPATMANALFQIHPNNYIWPAEDALRKGMLAMSSIHSEELIKMEIGEEQDVDMKEEAEPIEDKIIKHKLPKETEGSSDLGLLHRKNSFGNYGTNISMENKPPLDATNENDKNDDDNKNTSTTVNALDLDLFDPDEDDYSD
ncbi:Mediator of RNA polymerase II transcription subunit 4 [Scheffersomyces spartinae]|uniref:Mediator of RNA polymerase II transcription subunit 4 n=1 Tax=Scheffersomyces spartinae TaxID=45513 RepID=A0A9P7V7F1_9ASCO|nr:Mediator of RNA polymerase II transcription subunit 4 [Scheffersomyces spartinae]KAG7192755.1 Mediator of RNA polymerase II transcription subunit 4 [Scheffersomyces spartinae]